MGLFKIPEKELANYIKEITSGSKEALEQFYSRYGRSVYTLIFAYVESKESAENVMHEVLMKIVRYGFNKPVKDTRQWLFDLIKNAAVKKAAEDKADKSGALRKNREDTEDGFVFKMLEDVIDDIDSLKCLDPTEQKCVLLHIVGGIKLPLVAEIIGFPYEKTRNMYYYAVKKMGQYYEREGLCG